jgi:hypothetical protein
MSSYMKDIYTMLPGRSNPCSTSYRDILFSIGGSIYGSCLECDVNVTSFGVEHIASQTLRAQGCLPVGLQGCSQDLEQTHLGPTVS